MAAWENPAMSTMNSLVAFVPPRIQKLRHNERDCLDYEPLDLVRWLFSTKVRPQNATFDIISMCPDGWVMFFGKNIGANGIVTVIDQMPVPPYSICQDTDLVTSRPRQKEMIIPTIASGKCFSKCLHRCKHFQYFKNNVGSF
jgi:hypothetical protein